MSLRPRHYALRESTASRSMAICVLETQRSLVSVPATIPANTLQLSHPCPLPARIGRHTIA
ncbi:hypothetical protein Z947_4133 [Sulfitobacter geojensis]|nr:hypothetical protein Z947_4133 [Sulfitobacter geojensis]